MCDYPFFIPQVVLFANSSLFWFKVTNEHREFRNYLIYDMLTQFLRYHTALPRTFQSLRFSLGFVMVGRSFLLIDIEKGQSIFSAALVK